MVFKLPVWAHCWIYPEISTFDNLAQSYRSSEFNFPSVLHVFGQWECLLSSGVAPYP